MRAAPASPRRLAAAARFAAGVLRQYAIVRHALRAALVDQVLFARDVVASLRALIASVVAPIVIVGAVAVAARFSAGIVRRDAVLADALRAPLLDLAGLRGDVITSPRAFFACVVAPGRVVGAVRVFASAQRRLVRRLVSRLVGSTSNLAGAAEPPALAVVPIALAVRRDVALALRFREIRLLAELLSGLSVGLSVGGSVAAALDAARRGL